MDHPRSSHEPPFREMVDQHGELFRVVSAVETDLKPRYVYPGGYVTMGLVNLSRLRHAKLPVSGYQLALYIAEHVAPVSNYCHASNAEYGAELGIADTKRISKLLHKLVAARLIVRMGPRLIMVNPGWCFKGTPAQHAMAQQTWCQLNPIGLVPPREGDGQTAA